MESIGIYWKTFFWDCYRTSVSSSFTSSFADLLFFKQKELVLLRWPSYFRRLIRLAVVQGSDHKDHKVVSKLPRRFLLNIIQSRDLIFWIFKESLTRMSNEIRDLNLIWLIGVCHIRGNLCRTFRTWSEKRKCKEKRSNYRCNMIEYTTGCNYTRVEL